MSLLDLDLTLRILLKQADVENNAVTQGNAVSVTPDATEPDDVDPGVGVGGRKRSQRSKRDIYLTHGCTHEEKINTHLTKEIGRMRAGEGGPSRVCLLAYLLPRKWQAQGIS